MPISRSGTIHAKSPRSPGPARTPSSTSTPKFLPPSHSTAADGYVVRRSTHKDDVNGGHTRTHGKSPACPRTLNSGRGLPRILSVHTASGSESSTLSNVEEHVPDLNDLMKRQNIKSGFPELEAQLLPSLRDTIDRMTGVPRMSAYVTDRFGYDSRKRESKGTNPPRAAVGAWATPPASDLQDRYANSRDSPSHRHRQGPIPSHSYTHQVTPTPESSSTPRLKTPTKSVLKNSRSPLAKSSGSAGSTPSVLENLPSAAGSSLKTMKSLLSRKCSGKLRSPFNGKKSSPSSQNISREPSDGRLSPSPQHVISVVDANRLLSSRNDFQSNIPRLRTRFTDDLHNEDSDFENRFEVESRDRRKLTVTNAEVFVSESSSESDAELRYHTALNSRAAAETRYTVAKTDTVGLGLTFPQTPIPKERRDHRSTRHEDNRLIVTPEKNLRFSLPASDSAESSYSSDKYGNHCADQSLSNERAASNDAWRQGAFLPPEVEPEYNDNRQSRFVFAQRHREPHETVIPTESRSRFYRRSLSQSPTSMADVMSGKEETESEREGYTIRRTKTEERRRSSSCTPLSRSSTMYDDQGDLHSPRSTASQRYAVTTPRKESKMDDAGLTELIRRRNLSTNAVINSDKIEQQEYRQTKRKSTHENDMNRGRRETQVSEHRSRVMSPEMTEPEAWSYTTPRLGHSRERHHQRDVPPNAQDYRAAAARERSAFGIPPSESDEVLSLIAREPELSQADSDMSSIQESILRERECDIDSELTTDSILWRLSDEKDRDKGRTSRHVHDATPRLRVISPTLSSESTCEGHEISSQPNDVEPEQFRRITEEFPLAPAGPDSAEPLLTREGVIQEIFETEEELLRLLHKCVRLFILPLRVQNSRSWISGVPPAVARLLDWFDDIVNLHEQIYGALCSARDTMSPATDRVSESLRWFVLRVEVYQPYLVRLAGVKQEIQGVIEDRKSELGQFIRLQEKQKECEGWTLGRLLMVPINRLASYQDLFARMLDSTPKTHQDYLSTLSLSRSTDMALKVMTEVKIREDEYNLLKTFSSRIQGLPSANNLATRERRLLHSGPVQLVMSNLRDLSGVTIRSCDSKRISRSSKLLDAIGKTNHDFASLSSGPSSMTYDKSQGISNSTSDSVPAKSSWFSRLPLRRRSRAKSPANPTVAPLINDETVQNSPDVDLRTVDVHAFVFNDLVLLAQQGRRTGPEPSWVLSEDVGIFRPLSIARVKRRNTQEGMILSMEAAVVDHHGLNDDAFEFRTSSWKVVDFLISPPSPPSAIDDNQVDLASNDHFHPWLNSLRQCCKAILKKLTFIASSHQEGPPLDSDRLLDMQLIVSSLTASGLPMPRSPSGNLPDMHSNTARSGGGGVGTSSDEREERGWWSLRYQQVFREFQRQDSFLSDEDEEE